MFVAAVSGTPDGIAEKNGVGVVGTDGTPIGAGLEVAAHGRLHAQGRPEAGADLRRINLRGPGIGLEERDSLEVTGAVVADVVERMAAFAPLAQVEKRNHRDFRTF